MAAANYPRLQQKFSSKKNIKNILDALEKYFPDIFQLDFYEDQLEKGKSQNTRYWKFLETCVHALENLYTDQEIVQTIFSLLEKDKSLANYFQTTNLFVSDSKARQMALNEKLQTGTLTSLEPLTYIDIYRSLYSTHANKSPYDIKVIHLRHLPFLNPRFEFNLK